MLEIPEAARLSAQITEAMTGRSILGAIVGGSPHKFAWFGMGACEMERNLSATRIAGARPAGGMIAIMLGAWELVLCDGVSPRLHPPGEDPPDKHQLLLKLDDGSALTCSVQMYGGMYLFREGEPSNPYYSAAQSKPSPLDDGFSEQYFLGILKEAASSMSLKACLATGQRIPGLGNGVLQDILLDAGLHPRSTVGSLGEEELRSLFCSVKEVLRTMAGAGGRDTERDLFGKPGGYRVMAGKNTQGGSCPRCGLGTIQKDSYMGGSVYFCNRCQPLR